MQLKKKKTRIFIKLVSTANTGYYYTTKKNPQKTTDKLMLRKYDPIVGRHVFFQVRARYVIQPQLPTFAVTAGAETQERLLHDAFVA